MLDDINVINQRDPSGALRALYSLPEQAVFKPEIIGDSQAENIQSVVVTGMGGSALAAEMVRALVRDELKQPIEIVKGYDLPNYVDSSTLVIAISHSGNTEETLSCYDQARERGAVMAAMATGGELIRRAVDDGIVRAVIPNGAQPRMSTIYHLRTLLKILQHFDIVDERLFGEVEQASGWLSDQISAWVAESPVKDNYAKQIALQAAGKIGMFYAGPLTAPLAYKWKINWNETGKNLAFQNQYPEFSHNEFIGWSSHPVDKPFFVVDIKSAHDRKRIDERMVLTDKMLSGMRPHALSLTLQGGNLTEQLLWGLALGDAASIYLGIVNGVDPAPVALVEDFKKALG